MTGPAAIIFDFDGVLLESEYEGNNLLAQFLTDCGHPTSVEEAVEQFVGLNGQPFLDAIERHIAGPVPDRFHGMGREMRNRALAEGLDPVAGAVEFVRDLPAELPKAVASSSSTKWVGTHLAHLGLGEAFGGHVYSGKEHVARSKPAPDLYLFAAEQLGVDIREALILEDSKVGAQAALASGAQVIGLAAGRHCFAGHEEMLRGVGVTRVAHSFDQVRRLAGLT